VPHKPHIVSITEHKLENVAIIAMYCHLRPPDATADKSNAVSFRVAGGATLMPIRGLEGV